MQNLSAQWHSEKMVERRDQMRQTFQSLSDRIQQGGQELGSRIQEGGQGFMDEESITSRRQQIRSGFSALTTKIQQGGQELGTKLQHGSRELIGEDRKNQLKEGFQRVSSKLHDLNISSLSGSQEPALSDQLRVFNDRMKEEAMRRDVRREAEQACLDKMREHLTEFLSTHPNGTYEEWIEAFHPENTQDVTLLPDMECREVDLRFYVEESDHRKLWNSTVQDDERKVPARMQIWSQSTPTQNVPIMDLLDNN